MMTEDRVLLVARYAEGDLSDEERTDFELRLQHDEDLQQHLKEYKDIHQSLKMQLVDHNDDLAFKATLKGLNNQYFNEKPKTISLKPYIKWITSAAAVLIIGMFIWAPWKGNLYETYANRGEMLITERGATKMTNLDKAAELYNKGNYSDAKTLLRQLKTEQPTNTLVAYYYGLTLIETDATVESRVVLTPIFNGESVFKYDAAYSIALSYLKEGKKEECKIWLQKIPQGTTHYQQATILMEKL